MRFRTLLLLAFVSILSALSWGQLSNTQTTYPYCLKGSTYWGQITYYSNWKYTDTYGVHPFSGTSWAIHGSPANCPAQTTSGFTANSSDGLGYHLVTNGSSGTIAAPTITTGYVNPKYVILGVTYAPPGPSSFVNYSNSTLVGNTTSLGSSFSTAVTQSVSLTRNIGIKGWAGGSITATESSTHKQESASSTEVEITKQTTISDQTPGPANPYVGINHDYDVIWVWLNPLTLFTNFKSSYATAVQWNGYGYSTLDQPAMDVYPVFVGWLNGDLPMTPSQSAPLNRAWAATEVWPSGQGPALTATDLQNIMHADPYWMCTKTPSSCPRNVDPARFTLTVNQDFIYQQPAPGGNPLTQTYTDVYTDTTTLNQSAKYTYTQTFSVEKQFSGSAFLAGFNFAVSNSTTLEWSHDWNSSIKTSNSSTALLSITGPPCVVTAGHCNPVYTGPTQYDLYQDVLYGTFFLNPVN